MVTDSFVMRYFGERWDAPAFDDAVQVDRPVGAVCTPCGEPIAEDDSGTFWGDGKPVHIECWLRMGVGGPNHLLRKCSCYGGDQPPDPVSLSMRDAARMTKRIIEERLGIFDGS